MVSPSLTTALLLAGMLATPALGQPAPETAGHVKTIRGEVSVTTAGTTIRAIAGTPLHVGDLVKTGPASSLGLTLKDDTMLSLGADTELLIEDFLFAPTQGKLALVGRLARGTLSYVSGVIARLKPDAVSVHTPTGTIGVRGTRFVVKVGR